MPPLPPPGPLRSLPHLPLLLSSMLPSLHWPLWPLHSYCCPLLSASELFRGLFISMSGCQPMGGQWVPLSKSPWHSAQRLNTNEEVYEWVNEQLNKWKLTRQTFQRHSGPFLFNEGQEHRLWSSRPEVESQPICLAYCVTLSILLNVSVHNNSTYLLARSNSVWSL